LETDKKKSGVSPKRKKEKFTPTPSRRRRRRKQIHQGGRIYLYVKRGKKKKMKNLQ